MKCGVNTCWVISSGLGNAGVKHVAEQSPFNSLGFRLECYFWSLDFFSRSTKTRCSSIRRKCLMGFVGGASKPLSKPTEPAKFDPVWVEGRQIT